MGELSMIVNSIGEAPYAMRVRVKSAMFSDNGKVLLLAVDDGCGGMVPFFNTESGKSIGEFSPGGEDLFEGGRLDSVVFSQDDHIGIRCWKDSKELAKDVVT